MEESYSIKVCKQYFNFASSHFIVFKNGKRELLHGHNYKVKFIGSSKKLESDMVFNFLDIKPLIRNVCNSLDHQLLLPGKNKHMEIKEQDSNYVVKTPDNSVFSFPKQDVLILPLTNISVERLAKYISEKINHLIFDRFKFRFDHTEIEVEETEGQSAIFSSTNGQPK